ncbi:MAG: PKD-like family lipoprotein [Draconibacterium sp.]
MNKLLNILLIIGVMLIAFSCYKDQGNYDYSDWEEITITNVEDTYTKSFMTERLTVTPGVSSNIPDADIQYYWTYGGYKDTIATGAVLDTLVTWLPNQLHYIYLHAQNKKTGYTATKRFGLVVNTPFLNKWYVLKDDGQNSELDMYDQEDYSLTTNILKLVNGNNFIMRGKGEKFAYYARHYRFNEETTKLERTKTLFVLSEDDIVGVDAAQFNALWTYDNMFNITAEEEPGPSFYGVGTNALVLVNSGQVYTISSSSASNGKWGVKKEINLAGDPYHVSKYVFNDYFYSQLLFDDLGSSFYTVTNYNVVMNPAVDDPSTEMPATNNGKKLLYMGTNKAYVVTYGYAVMQDKTDPDLKMITRVKYGGSKVTLRNDTLQTGVDKAYNGQLFTMARPEQGLYFIADNALYYRNVSSKDGSESLEYELPAGETASFVRCDDNNYVVLGTQIGAGYKVRFFKKTTAGHINTVPDFTLPREGETAEGTARDIIFVNANMPGFAIYSW